MIVPNELKQLQRAIDAPLYIVGGAVRDFLAGFKVYDIDVTGPLLPGEIEKRLNGTPFFVKTASPRLGTVILCSREGGRYEYTAFRKDSYRGDGTHAPEAVTFTKDINEDAYRRDFSVNAVYYDIEKETYIDPADGIKDIENKIIKTVREPRFVFSEDALRILRMVRLSAATGFQIEENTYLEAKKLAQTVASLAAERVRDELNRIIVADTVNGIAGAHTKGMRMMTDLGLTDLILPGLTSGMGMAQRQDFHRYDVYEHILHAFDASRPDVRLAALFHDIAKPIMKERTGKMAGHDKEGAKMASDIMARLKYSNAEIKEVVRLVEGHMYDLNGETGEKKLRLFIMKNADILDKLLALKEADYLGSGIGSDPKDASGRMRTVYQKMKEEGVPFSVKELKINGEDLVRAGILPMERGAALNEILRLAATDPAMRTREAQLAYAVSRYKKR